MTRLNDIYQKDEAFEAERETRCATCGTLLSRWEGNRFVANLRVFKPDCKHTHWERSGRLPPSYCPEHCPK